MIHVGNVDEFAEADDLVMFLVEALVSLQDILGPVKALVSATTFRNADGIIRIIRIIDLNQPLVVAGLELSEPEGESPLLTHSTVARPSAQQIVYSPETALTGRYSMDDREFLHLFHEGSLPSEEFGHRGHLRLAWLVLSRHQKDEAENVVAREIRRFAIASGAPSRYHDTLTRFWVRLVGHAMENATEMGSIDDLLARFPFLLEKSLPYRHWRGETFNSDRARAGWVEPDLVPLP